MVEPSKALPPHSQASQPLTAMSLPRQLGLGLWFLLSAVGFIMVGVKSRFTAPGVVPGWKMHWLLLAFLIIFLITLLQLRIMKKREVEA